MNDSFIMEPFPMSEQDVRELSCKGHEGRPLAQCLDYKVELRCKHCGKLMGESDDEKLFNAVLKTELRGDYT